MENDNKTPKAPQTPIREDHPKGADHVKAGDGVKTNLPNAPTAHPDTAHRKA